MSLPCMSTGRLDGDTMSSMNDGKQIHTGHAVMGYSFAIHDFLFSPQHVS